LNQFIDSKIAHVSLNFPELKPVPESEERERGNIFAGRSLAMIPLRISQKRSQETEA
jgi:hypothetical protein